MSAHESPKPSSGRPTEPSSEQLRDESRAQSPEPSAAAPEDIRAWLASAVAEAAGTDPATLDPHRPLAEYGLGSRQLVALGTELSRHTGRTIEPTLLFDHPTLAAVADAVLSPPRVPSAPPPADAPPRTTGDDIAIISLACHLPGGADDPDALWRLLTSGEDAIGEVPAGRWDTHGLYDPDPEATGTAYTLRGGYLDGIDRFDAAFFGISPREAATMDPQQRLLLQTAWETFERAGIVPGTLDGTSTGVYVGLYDSGYLASAPLDRLDGHVGTGSAPSVASGRIAYALGLGGPAVTVDTACSSSLVALHLAARALAAGECDLALAGGATLLVTPRGHVEFSRLRALSPTGTCRPFSTDADGVVWAEGCGLVLLKRLADARRDGDTVLAVVKGSAINQDGRSQGLSAPNGPAQQRVLRAALEDAGLTPADLEYVEAHGTGTRLGDPVEGNALAAVFGPGRPADRPLGVGSLKSVVGHTQAAAGIGGVIKTVLALRHELIPASLHAGTPTEHVDWRTGGLRLLDGPQPWPRRTDRIRRAGVSAFGISGTNAHVVLEEAPGTVPPAPGRTGEPIDPAAGDRPTDEPAADRGAALFPLSARGLTALRGQAARLHAALTAAPELPLPAVAAALAHHRTHFEQRAVLHADGRDDLLAALHALAEGRPDPDRTTGPQPVRPAGKVAFVFPGQGAQWTGMARDLLERDAVFADELDRCDAALRPFTGWSVASVLRGDPNAPTTDRVDVVQPVLFAVMVSLAAVWRARGIRPDGVLGHSQGEVAAACVAGALSLNDAAAVVALRSQALTELSGTGTMAVVALPQTALEPRLAAYDGQMSVAAVNSDRATVVAGDTAAVDALVADLDREQVFARRLDVDYASHTAHVEPIRTRIGEELDGVVAAPASVAWYSTVTGEPVTGELDAGYWYTNLREPVRFASAAARMMADGYRWFVELSPHPSLLTAVRTIAEDTGCDPVAVGSLRRAEDGPACLDRAAAELHTHGRDIDWRRLVADHGPADLPTYAWDAQRHWTEPEATSAAPGLLDRAAHPLLGILLRSADATRWTFRSEWSAATADWLPDHTVFGRTVVSGTTLLELCRAALAEARPQAPADLTGLLVLTPLILPSPAPQAAPGRAGAPAATVEVSVEVIGDGPAPEVTVHSRPRGAEPGDWTLHATATAADAAPQPTAEQPPAWPHDAEPAWRPDTYGRLAERGLTYGPAFRGVREAVRIGDDALLARLTLPAAARDTADAHPVHPALLDAALHVAAGLHPTGDRVLLPVAIGSSVLPPGGGTELTALVRRTADTTTDLTLDVTLWDGDGFFAGRLRDVRLRTVDPGDLGSGSPNARHLYEVAWTAVGEAAGGPAEGTWAVLGDPTDPQVAEALRAGEPAGGAGSPARTVVRVWPLPDGEPGAAALELAATALAELQGLLDRPADEAPERTLWVTRGAVAAADGDTVPQLAQSVLWGLARTARAEHPELGLTLLDLDAPASADVLRVAAAQHDEPELALREGVLLAPRLVRARPGGTAPLAADGTVLITGGLGAVGRTIARLLAEQGVPRLLLTSRRGAGDPRAADLTADLTALGTQVEVAACDVADGAALAALLDPVDDLRGVVHCAGVLDDGVLGDLTPERLARVLRPKTDGAAHLHRLTADRELDLFLLVSSAAGVVGSAGQANYAAANVFLDQLAHHRRALGLPAVSIAFGAWAGEGLAAGHADLARMARHGHRALTPEQGRDLVELSLRRNAPHTVAWALDTARLRETVTGALWRSLLPAPPGAAGRSGALADRLAALPETERADRVLALVREETARVLGLRAAESVRPEQPLREIGMDSVTAVELRNRLAARLGVRLPATLLFDHPTPARLTGHLLTGVLAARDPAPAARPGPSASTAGAAVAGAPSAPAPDAPIAVVAMACRLPGGVDGPEDLWRLVAEGRDAVGPFPADRWGDVDALYDPDPDRPGTSYAREGGFLDGIDSFDAGFFGITPKEAAAMDPQQRLLLETAWEALERAGTVPADLAGSTTGVYVGMFGSDYLAGTRLDQLDGYVGTGSAPSVASGRLAYTLGLHGPAMTVDTACSSSLVATHLAAQALRSGECDLALAGGVTLMVTPQTFVEFSRLRGLSPTGRCRSFSDDADGAIWAEGAGMLVLKRLADARRDGDEVLAVLRGTAVNQDGRSQGLSAPNGPAQEQVLRRALERSGLGPDAIDYVEAHGTGTTLGDPIEAGALTAVFGAERPRDRPLYLGSLKSNIGHTQAASGVAGLIKVVQALRHGTLPATLHAAAPSRHVDWETSGLELLHEPAGWPASPGHVRRAGVSAFGISGTNAHVVVEEAPPSGLPTERHLTPKQQLFVVSGRSGAAVRGQAARLARHLATDTDPAGTEPAVTPRTESGPTDAAEAGTATDAAVPGAGPADPVAKAPGPGTAAPAAAATGDRALVDIAHTLARHRSHFERRAAIVAGDRDELRAALEALASGRAPLAPAREEHAGKVAFVFPGHGGQWPGMGLDLLADTEAFRSELSRIDEALRRHVDWSVLTALRAPEEFSPLDRTEYLQPALFAVNTALAAAWRSLGVVPDAVVGHSLGEIAAAHSAGALTLDEAATVVAGRAASVAPLVGQGGMLAVELPHAEVEELLTPYAGRLFVGAVNSAAATAVSGEAGALAELRRDLADRGVPTRPLSTPFASHSPLMEPLRAAFTGRLAGVHGRTTETPLYSTVLAEPVPGDRLDAAHWFANLRRPVRFADTVRRMLDDGFRYFVELSPHPSLTAAVEAVAAEAGVDAVTVPSLRRRRDGRGQLLRGVGELYAAGHTPDWTALHPQGRRVDLPTYAFARERHWLAPAPPTAPGASPLLATHVEASDEPDRHLFQTEIDLRDSRFAYLADHQVTGETWLPGAAFLDMALEAASAAGHGPELHLGGIRFVRPLRLDPDRPARLQLVLRPAADGRRDFTIASTTASGTRWEQHVTGHVLTDEAPAAEAEHPGESCGDPVDLPAAYAALAGLGIDYGPAFRALETGRRTATAAEGRLAERPAAGHLLHPAVLDAAFHTAALPGEAPRGRAFVPAGAARLRFTGRRTTPVGVTCHLRSAAGDVAVFDLRLWDADDRLLLIVEGFELAALSPLDGALYETRWQPRPPASGTPAAGGWLVLADGTGVGAELAARLPESVPCVLARSGRAYATEGPGRYVLDPADPQQLARLLDDAFPDAPPARVVQLSALDAPEITDERTAREAARVCCLSTLHLVRAFTARQQPAPRLFVVVRGTQAAGDSTRVTHPQQALAWGFTLSLAQEHPELAATLVDLPPQGGLDALWTQLWHADDERLVALSDSGRTVPRLARTRPDGDGAGDSAPDGVHLITGGLGGLGRVVAERLVRRGVRRLALLGRGSPDAETARWIDGLEQRGVDVHLPRADVADRAALAAALDGVRRAAGPIVRIVHAAGVLDDATAANLTPERVLRVLDPKVLGTAHLTELVPEARHMVLFASAAGLLGSAGQSAYAAANAFLDAWAHHLSRTGRPALSLDWGAWAGIGMVAASGPRAAETGRSGLIAFTPEEGGELFDRVLSTGRRQLAPLALDRELLALAPDAARTRPILAGLVPVPAGGQTADGLVQKVFAAPAGEERTTWLEAYVRARVGEVSGGTVDASATTALNELGLDSLMLVRLRNTFARELGAELPAADVFAATDIRGLSRTLADALPERPLPAAAPSPADPGDTVPETAVFPATRDVVRLLRSARPGMPDAAHGVGLAVRLTTPTTCEELTAVLDRLTARHAALRTAVVTGSEDGQRFLRVDRSPQRPLLRWTELPGDVPPDAAERLRVLLEEPFDLTRTSLWRFELLDSGPHGQLLVYGAHHAVSDLQSLLLVAGEIDAELSGAELDGTATNRDVAALVEAQRDGGGGPDDEWRAAFHGSERLDLELSRPRPAARTYRAGSVTAVIPDGLMDRVTAAASRLAVTPAAFCLGTLTVLLARKRHRERFALAVPVDTRIHADAPDAVGFYGVPVPFPAEARRGEQVAAVLRRTGDRLQRLLERGAAFTDVLATLTRQGLHRQDAPLVEVYFNYVRSAHRTTRLEVLPAGTGHSDLDLMVTMTPDAGRIRLDHNLDILDADAAAGLAEEFLHLLGETARDPAVPVRPAGGHLAVAATFALGNLPLMCRTAVDEGSGDAPLTVTEAPYHQVLATLQDPTSVFCDPATAVGVVLLRAADLERFGPVDDALLAELRAAYPAALRSLAERTRKPLLVGFLPCARPDERLTRWEEAVAADLDGTPGIAVLGPGEWTRHHPVDEPFDERTERLAHLPFTPPFQAAVALRLAEAVHAVRRPVPKVIAVDGDETLWGGVAGETGPGSVDLTGPRELLARRLLQWRAAGALLVLVSNNDDATVRAVLDRPDSPLRAEHFSVVSAAWEPKPDRLAQAARTLNLGLDSFLFLDDNPAEIARMRAALPQVLSVTCPPADRMEEFLGRLWPLVPAAATAEDALRARFYDQERERDAVREASGFEEFLQRLELEVEVRALTEDDVQRAEQLVRRTNQFTLRARSADGGDLARWRERGEVWTAAARDRFGDYGQIGLLAVRAEDDRLDVLAWLMSCRALGRGVEERLLSRLADRADELGCTKVRLTAERTQRNAPARRLLVALGGADPDDERLEIVTTPEHLRAFRSWQQQ
ncbi:SDR family NAD(P)-dependent oxidoreductase [Streptomyces sp. MUM 136J]|uniref:type I polyketide synthase n=1 Tax=Streptomyces sp. MUM 136J TaxID=2791992 RepID=UPI001F03CF0A|nr:type I polyketide synthase [Streptomyces sp. MUM 136J]MCH0571008.1 SDR family NAD(P)-dependent oxidoreductase [Streptomyces sp. MUM 136J]